MFIWGERDGRRQELLPPPERPHPKLASPIDTHLIMLRLLRGVRRSRIIPAALPL